MVSVSVCWLAVSRKQAVGSGRGENMTGRPAAPFRHRKPMLGAGNDVATHRPIRCRVAQQHRRTTATTAVNRAMARHSFTQIR